MVKAQKQQASVQREEGSEGEIFKCRTRRRGSEQPCDTHRRSADSWACSTGYWDISDAYVLVGGQDQSSQVSFQAWNLGGPLLEILAWMLCCPYAGNNVPCHHCGNGPTLEQLVQ